MGFDSKLLYGSQPKMIKYSKMLGAFFMMWDAGYSMVSLFTYSHGNNYLNVPINPGYSIKGRSEI